MDNEKTQEIDGNELIEQLLEAVYGLREEVKNLSDQVKKLSIELEIISSSQKEHGSHIEHIRRSCESRLQYCAAVGTPPPYTATIGDDEEH